MQRLNDRYILSVILSFLTETEGTSLLLCRKSWATRVLPIFRLPPGEGKVIGDQPQVNGRRPHRHRFIVYPVPDAATRLDRLNTRKWRRMWKQMLSKYHEEYYNQSMREIAKKEWIKTHHNRSDTESAEDSSMVRRTNSQQALLQFWSPVLEKSLLHLQQQQPSSSSSCLFLPGITLLASYPRSGNTYVRSLLESITGFVTLSDTRSDRSLSIALAEQHGLVGEGLCQPPLCKTHWPERMGCGHYQANRVILLVRNPWDAIDSYWHLNATNTHTQKVTAEVYQQHQDLFQSLVRNELHVWSAFLDFYWNDQSVEALLVRYEDLMRNPQHEMQRVLTFCTPSDWWRPRLDAVIGQNVESSRIHGYQSATSNSNGSASSGIGRTLKVELYQRQLLEDLRDKIDHLDPNRWMHRLGYDIWQQDFPNNLARMPDLPVHRNSQLANSNRDTISVNDSVHKELRPRNSPFGRNMRSWRRQHTNDDQNPFPTVSFEKRRKN
ncbi:sulfotransferase family protein [Nitzschia inconspicua]|uniref:Sulfotransferase family protein n=1 Tax=Nitzschia inconspicua TaxID=303405 RepID=A0A9K3L208_9STRA|nr:sulfotransferase family protein [Nitzschia inconspicua]